MKGFTKRRWVAALAVFVLVAACAASAAFARSKRSHDQGPPSKLTIAYQPGLGYAPLIIMKMQRRIEKLYPGTKVEWKVLASGTPITNGVISGDIEIGAVGTGPMLVGWARGVGWKVIAPLNVGDLWLMAKDPRIRTIADLRGKRVATPTNTSIQAIVLRKMAQVKLGDAHALDSTLVAMDHPDGMQALLTGQIDAHFTSPPFQFQEKVRGAHIVGRSSKYMGRHTFLVTVMTQKFYDDHTAFAKTFYKEVVRAEKLIKKKPDLVAKMLQQDAGGTPTNRQFKQWLVNKALTWSTKPEGMIRTARFMNNIAVINKMPGSWKDLVFPPVYPTKGS